MMDHRKLDEMIDACRPGSDDIGLPELSPLADRIEGDPDLDDRYGRTQRLDAQDSFERSTMLQFPQVCASGFWRGLTRSRSRGRGAGGRRQGAGSRGQGAGRSKRWCRFAFAGDDSAAMGPFGCRGRCQFIAACRGLHSLATSLGSQLRKVARSEQPVVSAIADKSNLATSFTA